MWVPKISPPPKELFEKLAEAKKISIQLLGESGGCLDPRV
jgi:hypothetical protein